MSDFETAYEAWRRQPLPPGSADDSLDELHADLVLADAWVADSVIPYVERGIYQPAQPDVVEELGNLRSRAAKLRERDDGGDPSLAGSYGDYVELLLCVYQGFLAQAGRG